MAEIQDPAYLENGSHTAQNDRLVLQSLVAKEGIVGAGALAVSEKSGTPDMSVDVAAGAAFIAGELGSAPGTYHVYNDAVKNLAISAADATNPRKDLVVARVYDSFYSGATDSWALEVVTGTPAASPAEPAVPDNCYVLALVDVAALATSITDADITDRRKESSAPTGLRAIVTFTSSGTFTKANYQWLRAVRVRVVGGGGGGTGNGNGGLTGGPGGGGGGYAEAMVDVGSLGSSETVTVGAGGAGSSGFTAGTAGGQSSFGAHAVATGGSGGEVTGLGGLRGLGSTGDVLINGEDGASTSDQTNATIGASLPGGNGGSSALGGGGRGGAVRATDTGGAPGRGPGGGGGGGYRASSPTTGGNGSAGIVIVELYA